MIPKIYSKHETHQYMFYSLGRISNKSFLLPGNLKLIYMDQSFY